MKYENARDVLPEPLLRQIQKYVSGKLLYIPSREHKREWGAVSGYRQYLLSRNQDIRTQFALGESVEDLADAYHLSCESIRRIVYNRKENINMKYAGTLTSAMEWAQHGRLEEWVHLYLLTDGHNREFSDGLHLVDRQFLGPAVMPLELFQRCCGPETGMRWQIPEQSWEGKVESLLQAIQSGVDLPPLIVHYLIEPGKKEGEFELNDGNHRFEAYQRLGVTEAAVIVWITDRDEQEQFMQRFGEYF